MNSIVTSRFIACHKVLRKERIIRSSRQMALSLDYLPQSLSEILNGRRDVTIELLRKAVECYRLNPVFLFSGEGDMFLPPAGSAPAVTPVPSESPSLLHIPATSQSDYARGAVPATDLLVLPEDRLRNGCFRAFEVAGDAMFPVLRAGDKVIASYVPDEEWNGGIRAGDIHVVVTRTDVHIRRADSRSSGAGEIRLYADNDLHPALTIPFSAVREVWSVELRLGVLQKEGEARPPIWRELAALRAAVTEQGNLLRQWQESQLELR